MICYHFSCGYYTLLIITCLYHLRYSSSINPSSFSSSSIRIFKVDGTKIPRGGGEGAGGSIPPPPSHSYIYPPPPSSSSTTPPPPPIQEDEDAVVVVERQTDEPFESVEDRIAAWRSHQQYKYQHLSPMDVSNPREEDGRMKLLASVSKGSIAIFFFILMWRSVHHFELADQSFQGVTRLLFVIPMIGLFIGNMAGCVAAITTFNQKNSAKKRMKAILNLNKMVELSIFIYNLFRYVNGLNRTKIQKMCLFIF